MARRRNCFDRRERRFKQFRMFSVSWQVHLITLRLSDPRTEPREPSMCRLRNSGALMERIISKAHPGAVTARLVRRGMVTGPRTSVLLPLTSEGVAGSSGTDEKCSLVMCLNHKVSSCGVLWSSATTTNMIDGASSSQVPSSMRVCG
ncbi:hypothetical protein M378DRAFT_649870 [Amanita muscaria Koide BX008]|uniref:Uncharacterized protein n=1 Tax=Amanita muscaria (strain Koide BX008) TaxID=946122 RepID=A0A0C2TAQ4_AMAMK|nr:hypothetical protein M378DRAFT_649870 [Amanita muscaria Koide BX008]